MMDGKWQHDQAINLQRYPDYAGTPGFADNIELRIYQGDAAWLDFQAGNLDITLVGSDHLNEARQTYAGHAVGGARRDAPVPEPAAVRPAVPEQAACARRCRWRSTARP